MSLTLPPSSTISDNMSENFSTKHSPLTQSRLQRLLQLAIPDDDGEIITKISPHHTSIKQQDTPISTSIKQQDTPTSTSIKQQDTPTSIKHQDTSTCEKSKCTPPHKDESIYQHETHQESQLSIPSSLTMPTHLRSATLPLSRSIYDDDDDEDDDDDDDDEYFSYPVLMTRSLRRATAPLASISAVSEAYPSRSTMLPTRTLTPAPTSTRRGSTSSFRHSRPTVPMDLFQHNTSPTVRTRSINVASRTISPVPSCPDSYTCTRRSSMSTMSMLSDTSTTSFMTFEAQSAACEREILSHECSMLSHAISKEKASQAIIDYLASQPEDPMENNDWADHVETATPQQQAINDSIDEMIRISRNLVTDSDTEDSAHELPAALRTNTALYRYAHNPNYSNSPSHVSQTIPITFTPSRKAAALMGEDVPTFDLNKSLPPSPKHTSQPSSTSPQSSSSSPSHTEPSPEQVEKKKSISIDTREEPNPATRTDMESPAGCGCCIM